MAEIFKTIKNENPPFLKEIFVREDSNLTWDVCLDSGVLTTKNS